MAGKFLKIILLVSNVNFYYIPNKKNILRILLLYVKIRGNYMKISAINTFSRPAFQGENSGKKNAVRNAAGAAVIAIAAAVPAEEAKSQYYIPPSPPIYYYVPNTVMRIPNCFVYGDINNEDYEKSMRDVFSEVDGELVENGQISVNEVVRLEENNWNSTKLYPMSRSQKNRVANLVKKLSRDYNEYGSNPNTINYSEYKEIMSDYMKSKNISDFFDLLRIFSYPYYYNHHHYHPVPPPPRRHPLPPPPPHRHW